MEKYEALLNAGNPGLYTICVFAASLVGGSLVLRDSKSWPLNSTERRGVFLCAFIGGILGSAIPAFLAGDMVENAANTYLIGPKTILGGLLGSYWCVSLFKRFYPISYDTSDAFARGLVVIMFIGRIGCVLAHCCFGKEAHWGVDLGDGHLRYPVPQMEIVLLFVVFCLIQYLHRKQLFAGRRLFIVFTLYGLGRFFLEFFREPIATQYNGLTLYHGLALLLFLVGANDCRRRSEKRVVEESWAAG